MPLCFTLILPVFRARHMQRPAKSIVQSTSLTTRKRRLRSPEGRDQAPVCGEPLKKKIVNTLDLNPAMSQSEAAEHILRSEKRMSEQLSGLSFGSPVTHVYDPLVYAWKAHEWYVEKYAKTTAEIILVGMNPGPWGMAQTGVPFGEVEAVTSFLRMPPGIEINKPQRENVQRRVEGLSCPRSEVSGRRLWREWAAAHFDNDPDKFFGKYYVHNYCPLMFMESGGRNRTPVQLKVKERQAVEDVCDVSLRTVVHALKPKAVCGIGGYAKDCCQRALQAEIEAGLHLATVLHPSPASPVANRGWVEQAVRQLDVIQGQIDDLETNWTQILHTDN